MKHNFWRVPAALLAVALGIRWIWSLGLLPALAARLDPAETPPPVLSAPPPSPTAAPPPTPSPTAPSGEAPAVPAMAALPRLPAVRDATNGATDLAALLAEGWSARLPADKPQILILHSHSTEAYTPEGEDVYEASDPGRTLDKSRSVIRVGDELGACLEEAGLQVLHDRELYDWPNYNGAYGRSRKAAEEILEENPGIRVVIDLHRDALNGVKTEYAAADKPCAQVMLLLTTGESGLYHPNWQENVKLGLELQRELEEREPGLARPLYLSPERYNQQLSPGSLLVEVGTDANTLQEALEAVRRFADCMAAVLLTHLAE